MRLAYWFDFESCGKIDDKLSANDLKDMFSDITFEDCKPFPTCETCKKWKKKTGEHFRRGEDPNVCNLRIIYKTVQYNNGFKTTPPDFFCAGHSDFNPDDGGNNG